MKGLKLSDSELRTVLGLLNGIYSEYGHLGENESKLDNKIRKHLKVKNW
jgi:hypothetical protein